MSAEVSSASPGAPPVRHSRAGRIALAVLGAAAVVVGGVLLANPVAAARTLALLLGLALVVTGFLEIAVGWDTDRRGTTTVLGAVLVVGGLLAAFWPDVTLWTLAVLTGVSLLLHGIGRVAVALLERAEIPGWGWLALAGAVNVVVGVLVLTWPEATVLVLSLLLGAQILVFGLIVLTAAFLTPRSGI
ncbi:HdeD family acid-resistance protein [Trujillonella endophytica]|uniref:Uncharacterized membrane protein HdeD, DUF308 family n=1 Tax=Trujillonella endophytica TaxID=673521 RepID=A0A1H8QPM4_9ACTN|nr:DUF308 domain-containing protein [Trujillella endophytica]SEO56006.1 Uncharacterized membrane protein HdeD, DUF308 family [Trujillella endophytica]